MDCSQDSVIVTANNLELCKIWYHLCNLKKVKNTHGGVLLLVKLQGPAFFFFSRKKSNTFSNKVRNPDTMNLFFLPILSLYKEVTNSLNLEEKKNG